MTDVFVVRSDLRRPAPGPDADLLRLDDAWPRYAAAKLAALDADPDGFALAEPGDLPDVFDEVLARLADAHPDVVAAGVRAGRAAYAFPHAGLEVAPRAGEVRALVPAARPLAERLRALAPARRVLAAIAVSLQEDLVLMAERDGELVAHALAVALPSGWWPREKLGRPLHAIHAPLAEVAASTVRRERLVRALRSMSDDVVRYKGLAGARDAVLRAWGEGVR